MEDEGDCRDKIPKGLPWGCQAFYNTNRSCHGSTKLLHIKGIESNCQKYIYPKRAVLKLSSSRWFEIRTYMNAYSKLHTAVNMIIWLNFSRFKSWWEWIWVRWSEFIFSTVPREDCKQICKIFLHISQNLSDCEKRERQIDQSIQLMVMSVTLTSCQK